MKIIKKVLALALGAVIAMGSAVPVSIAEAGNADVTGVYDINTIPEGFEAFENTELYEQYSEYFDDLYFVYRHAEDPRRFVSYYHFTISRIDITITNDTWEEIYNKYSEKLGMDNVTLLSDGTTVRIEEAISMSADAYEDPKAALIEKYNAIEEKYALLMQMCSEMYQSDCIEAAAYRAFHGSPKELYTGQFLVEEYAGTLEELEAVVTNVCADAVVKKTDTNYRIVCPTAEDFFAAAEAVKAMEGEHIVDVDINVYYESGEAVPELGSEVIDMISVLQEAYAFGDINADGTTDITDAVLILQHYAEIAASGASAAAETNMDVNGDGSVDLDDAAAVLQIYAENAAGV